VPASNIKSRWSTATRRATYAFYDSHPVTRFVVRQWTETVYRQPSVLLHPPSALCSNRCKLYALLTFKSSQLHPLK